MAQTSNEIIISALMTHGTVKEAAESVGLSPRSIYERMKKREFREEYKLAKSEITRSTIKRINSNITAAIDVIANIMQNDDNNPAIRLQAAQTLLNTATRFSDRLQKEEEIAEQEESKNPFNFDF